MKNIEIDSIAILDAKYLGGYYPVASVLGLDIGVTDSDYRS
ncbi:hypothetical protein [Peribacillus frigoritolerans]|nr:hypothetical protein [Peribacillus frigoritolerans]